MMWLMECISCCSMEVKFKKHKLTIKKNLKLKFFSFPFHEIPIYDSSRGSILCRLWIYLLTARKHIKILNWYEIQKFIPILFFFSHYMIGCTCVLILCVCSSFVYGWVIYIFYLLTNTVHMMSSHFLIGKPSEPINRMIT